jgi:amino acid transporter
MTENARNLPPTGVAPPSDSAQSRLHGNIGVLELMFTVMAFNAPIVVFLAFIPVAILEGDGAGTPAMFIACGVVITLLAVGLTTMARILPKPGGFYAFITAGLGRLIGLGSGLIAAVSYYLALLSGYALGGIALNSLVHTVFHGPDIVWWAWSALLWVVVSVLGYLRVDLSAKVLTVALACELLVVVIYDISVLVKGGAHGLGFQSFSPHQIVSGSVGIAFMFGIGLFGGFEATIIFRDEVRNPRQTIPRATYGVVAMIAIVYAVTAWLFIESYGISDILAVVTNNTTAATTDSIKHYSGNILYVLASIMLVTSSFALILSAHNITSRYLFNLSADGIIHRSLARVHKRFDSPYRASMAVSTAAFIGMALLLVAGVSQGTIYGQTVGVYSYTLVLLLVIVSVAICRYCMKNRREFDVPIWNALIAPGIAFLLLCVALYLSTVNFTIISGASEGVANAIVVGIYAVFLLGVGMAARYRKTRPDVYASIGRQAAE